MRRTCSKARSLRSSSRNEAESDTASKPRGAFFRGDELEKVLDAVAGSLAHAGPEWVIALGPLAAWIAAKACRVYKATKLKRIEIEAAGAAQGR